MKYTIIVGSHRKESQSTKVGKYVANQLSKQFPDDEVDVIDLSENPLPLWSENAWDKDSELTAQLKPYMDKLESSDGFVVIAPEWSGMVPAGLKNFFLYTNSAVMGHKPGLIISVSSAHGGSYPVAELRMSSYKNTRICYIPDHVIVEKVEDVLNTMDMNVEDKKDGFIKNRINYSISMLGEYAKALKPVRSSSLINYKDFPYGM